MLFAVVYGRSSCKIESIVFNNEASRDVHIDFAVGVGLREGSNIIKLTRFHVR
jgi:hypothetical protein